MIRLVLTFAFACLLTWGIFETLKCCVLRSSSRKVLLISLLKAAIIISLASGIMAGIVYLF